MLYYFFNNCGGKTAMSIEVTIKGPKPRTGALADCRTLINITSPYVDDHPPVSHVLAPGETITIDLDGSCNMNIGEYFTDAWEKYRV
jgi:hypothetical protein